MAHLVRLRSYFDLAQDYAVGMIERGQQVIRPGSSPLADPRNVLPSTATTGARPAAARSAAAPTRQPAIEGIGVQALQGPPDGGLARHHASDPELGAGPLISVGGPLRDRGERAGTGQHRAHRQAHNRRQPVAHPRRARGSATPASTAVPPWRSSQVRHSSEKVANSTVTRR